MPDRRSPAFDLSVSTNTNAAQAARRIPVHSARLTPRRPLRALCALAALAALLAGSGCRSSIDDQDREAFRAKLGSTSFTVYPAHLHRHDGSTFDEASAVRLAAVLNDEGYGRAVASDRHAPIDVEPGMNQLRMWRDTAAQFGAWIAAEPPETDYAILTEQLGGGEGHVIGGLHAFVVDRSGKLVDGLLLNSHHDGFEAAQARTPAEGTEVLVTVLREDWAPRLKR